MRTGFVPEPWTLPEMGFGNHASPHGDVLLAPKDDDLFQARWWRLFLQWRHLCPGWREDTLRQLLFHLTDSSRLYQETCCVVFNTCIFGLFVFLLHGEHINGCFKHNLLTSLYFPLAFLTLYLFRPKHGGPSAPNDEKQNVLLCTSATAALSSYCNETEQAVRVVCVPVSVRLRCVIVF